MDNKYLFTDNIEDIYINTCWGLKDLSDISIFSDRGGSGKTKKLLRLAINLALMGDKKVLILDFEGSYLGYYNRMLDKLDINPKNLSVLEYNLTIKQVEDRKSFIDRLRQSSFDYLIVDNLFSSLYKFFPECDDKGYQDALQYMLGLVEDNSDNFDKIIIENIKRRG